AGGTTSEAGGTTSEAGGTTSEAGGNTSEAGGTIEAAGGVVLRSEGHDREVLVVHRVRHQDWSLPKGKLDPGERAEDAAVREVEEETGVHAELGPELPDVRYRLPTGLKHVRWFRMSPVRGEPRDRPPDGEVDVARWVSIDEALALLTYDQDIALLRHTLDGDRT
ncbi:MAG: NUDIX hydrolase, partial [Ignavibacteriaceae bacterium]